jgi:hypothetical protein
VAANEMVAELMGVSFAIFEMQKMQFMMEHTHIMAIPTAYPLPKFTRRYPVAQEGLNLIRGHEQSIDGAQIIALVAPVKMYDACSNRSCVGRSLHFG